MKKTFTHEQVQEILRSGHNLSNIDQEALDTHLAQCQECRSYAEVVKELSQAVPKMYASLSLSPSDIRQKALASQPQLRSKTMFTRLMHGTTTFVWLGASLVILLILGFSIPQLIPKQPGELRNSSTVPLAATTPTQSSQQSSGNTLTALAQPSQVDLSKYKKNIQTISSTSGSWSAEILRADATDQSPRQEDFNRITVSSKNGNSRWVIEEWTPHGIAKGGFYPTQYKWWPLDPNYFYWSEAGVKINPSSQPATCGEPYERNIRRLDLRTGEITSVDPFGGDWKGNLAFSPDTNDLSYVDGSTLKIRDLQTGEERVIPFQPMKNADGDWGPFYQKFLPENQGILLSLDSPWPPCGQHTHRFEIVYFDLSKHTSIKQAVPSGDMNILGWEAPSSVLLKSIKGKHYRMNMDTGKVEEIPVPAQDQAYDSLNQFLGLINAAYTFDLDSNNPINWDRAAQFYAGSWEELIRRYPDVDAKGPGLLLQRACKQNEMVCLMPKDPIFKDLVNGVYTFRVSYQDASGGLATLPNGQTFYEIQLKQGPDGKYRVMNLPPVK